MASFKSDSRIWIFLLSAFTLFTLVSADRRAICEVQPNSAESGLPDSVEGTVSFEQEDEDPEVTVTIDLGGFNTTDTDDNHGFHVHVSGVTSGGNDCSTAGGHYNPDNNVHGAPSDNQNSRHTGDLGNIAEDNDGNVDTTITDSYISLQGDYNIIGRAIVIHQTQDTLDESVDASGGAGTRIACCTIVEDSNLASHVHVSSVLLIMALVLALFS